MNALFTSYVENNFHEYQHIQSIIIDGGQIYGVSYNKFDPYEELLWVGNVGGHVTSYFGDHLERYTSFQIQNNEEIRSLLPLEYGLFSLTANFIKMNTRQGLPQLSLKLSTELYGNAQCMLAQDHNIILIGGHADNLLQIDLNRFDQQIQIPLDPNSSTSILKINDKYLYIGDANGRITARDVRGYKTEHTIQAHAGSLSDFDIYNNTLVTCGGFNRQGMLTYERFVKFYDIRTMKSLPPLQVKIDPMLLRFIHTYTDRVLVMSQTGSYQLLDPKAAISPPGLVYNFDPRGALVSCMDLSSNHKALAIGDISGCLHLLNTNQNDAQVMEGRVNFNEFSRPTQFPDPVAVEPYPYIGIDDYSVPFSTIPLPDCPVHGGSLGLASDWPQPLMQRYDRRPLPIDPVILESMKISHFVGYAPNPRGRVSNLVPYDLTIPPESLENNTARYLSAFGALFPVGNYSAPAVSYHAATSSNSSSSINRSTVSATVAPGNSAVSGAPASSSTSVSSVKSASSVAASSSVGRLEARVESVILIPQIYQKQVLQNAWPHVDNLNFKDYNPTPFATLEYTSPNSYLNVIIQILYYIQPFRLHILNHLCEKEYCLSCELAFLFHMMNMTTNNEPCQALNFLRAFKNLREASALGLILEEKDVALPGGSLAPKNDTKTQGFDKHALVENFNRFIYPQLHQEFMTSVNINDDTRDVTPLDDNNDNEEAAEESSAIQNPIQDIFMSEVCESLKCASCKGEFFKIASVYSFPLKYPKDFASKDAKTYGSDEKYIEFGEFVRRSMLFSQNTRAFCEVCKRFQYMEQSKGITKLPQVLIFNCQTQEEEKRAFWGTQQEGFVQRQAAQKQAASKMARARASFNGNGDHREMGAGEMEANLNSTPACRFGVSCHAARCKYAHPCGDSNSVEPVVRPKMESAASPALRRTWLAPTLRIETSPNNLSIQEPDLQDEILDPRDVAPTFDLTAIVVCVRDHKGANLVDYIRLLQPNTYPPRFMWYLFNDFCVFKVTAPGEAMDFATNWKTPCILYYVRRGAQVADPGISTSTVLPPPLCTIGKKYLSAPSVTKMGSDPTLTTRRSRSSDPTLDPDPFGSVKGSSSELWLPPKDITESSSLEGELAAPTTDKDYRKSAVVPLDFARENFDPASFLISLDAEFVVLNQQEAHLHSDGTHTMVKPSQMALARISCVRGYLPLPGDETELKKVQSVREGVPFLDEYICVPGNQVVDYVTKYSGIKHGDLDAHTSSKNPVGLKRVYLQLRYLVDSGFTFVGHNIRKDFQIINITVPSSQIVDTAILFSLPKKRTISLKFLVWYYFRQIIQQDTHDSVEDAMCALKLYKLYLQLTAKLSKDKFTQNLKDLYQKGHSLSWEVPRN